jgi:hypothetical protein
MRLLGYCESSSRFEWQRRADPGAGTDRVVRPEISNYLASLCPTAFHSYATNMVFDNNNISYNSSVDEVRGVERGDRGLRSPLGTKRALSPRSGPKQPFRGYFTILDIIQHAIGGDWG